MGIRDILSSVAKYLSENNIDFCIIGAFAMISYGYERATKDVDIALCIDSTDKLGNKLISLGFENIHKTDAFISYLHLVGNVRIDIMVLDKNTADKVFDAANYRIIFGDVKAPVVSIKHLIEMKLFAVKQEPGRLLKDLADIKELYERNPGLSRNSVSSLFSKYELEKYLCHIFRDI